MEAWEDTQLKQIFSKLNLSIIAIKKRKIVTKKRIKNNLFFSANNRALHPKEAELLKQNARRFAKEKYKTDDPTPEQIQGALSSLANTAQNLIDYNLGYDVPYSAQAEAFLHTLQSEYAATNPSLSIGNGQFLFYATND